MSRPMLAISTSSALLADLALVLGIAAVTLVFCRVFRQPTVLGYLLAGLIVGPNVPIPLFADAARVATLSELGVIFVMFGIGLEFSIRRLAVVLPRTGVVAVLEVGGMAWLGYSGARLLGWSPLESVFTGAALCISSTMVVARLFASRRVKPGLSELVYSVLVLQDLAAVVLIALLTALATGTADSPLPATEAAMTAGKLLAFLVGMVVVGFLVVPRAVRALARTRQPEMILVCSVGLCFGMAQLAHVAGFSVALGAFLAGSLVAESGQGNMVARTVRPLRDLFAAIFFVTVGMLLDPAWVLAEPGAILLLSGLVIVGQLCIVTVGAVLAGYGVRRAVQAGTSLAQVGEFSFIIVGIGTAAGVVRPQIFSVIVAVSVVTTFTTPYLSRAGLPIALFLDRHMPHALQIFVALYGTWRENLSSSQHKKTLSAIVRRSAAWLLLDAALLVGIVIGTALAIDPVTGWAQGALGVPPIATFFVVTAVAVAVASPFVLGVMHMVSHLGSVLARAALPKAGDGQVDFAAAPRRAYLVTVQLSLALSVFMPVAAVTQPFVPGWASVSLLGLILLWMSIVFWRGAVNLAEHAHAGAEVVAELLARQADEDPEGWVPPYGPDWDTEPERRERVKREQAMDRVQELMPGFGRLVEIDLDDEASVVGRSLRDVDLRGRTGASVFAIGRGGERIVAPLGDEMLSAGDRLCLAGTEEAITAARVLLSRRDLPGGPEVENGGG